MMKSFIPFGGLEKVSFEMDEVIKHILFDVQYLLCCAVFEVRWANEEQLVNSVLFIGEIPPQQPRWLVKL